MTPAELERALRRAIEADELPDAAIARELGTTREEVSRARRKMRIEIAFRFGSVAPRRAGK